MNLGNDSNPDRDFQLQIDSKEIEQSTQVLLAFMNYQWSQAKQSEDQRSAITNFIST